MYIQLYEIYKTASSITYTAHSTLYTCLYNNASLGYSHRSIEATQHITHEMAKKKKKTCRSLHLWALIKLAFLMLI